MATAEEIKQDFALQNALRDSFWLLGLRLLPDREADVLAHLRSLGVKVTTEHGYLEATTAEGTGVVLSAAAETIRSKNPTWFASDPKRDAVSSREDLERGSASEVLKAKSDWIKSHGLTAWEHLPRTKADAEKKAVVPNANMTRSEYLSLPFSERSKLSGILGPAVIGRIMARVK